MSANADCGAVAGSVAFTFSHGHQGDVTAGADVEAILAGPLHGERYVRSVHLVNLAAVQLANPKI
jgi:hypothetical protein